MNTNQGRTERLEDEPLDPLTFAGEYHRRKARRAATAKDVWKASGCDILMTFVDFKQQGRRNRILKGFNRQPIFLAGEGKPNTIH